MSKTLSPSETRLLGILQEQDKPIATTDLTKIFYRGEEEPEHAQKVVSGIVRSLEYKTRKDPERVKRSRRRGPHPVLVWIEQRRKKQ